MSRGKDVETYTTSRGVMVEILALSPFEMQEVLQTVPLPEVPTRVLATGLADYDEVEQLSADNLLNDDERATWAKYVKARDEAERKRRELMTDYTLLEGTRFTMDDLEAWKAKREKWGLPIPERELEVQKLYYRTHIIGSGEDIKAISDRVAAKSGVDEATLKQVQSTFQRDARGRAAGATARAAGEVELQHSLPGDEGGEGVGGDPA